MAHFTAEGQALLAYLDQGQQAAQQAAVQQQLAAAAAGHPHPGHPQLHVGPQPGAHSAQLPGAGRAPPLVDPAAAMRPIMDRAALIPHLEAAALAVRQLSIPARAPASVLVSAFDPATTPRQLAAAGVSLPCIAKPQAACGVAEAHQMAFVLHGCVGAVGVWRASSAWVCCYCNTCVYMFSSASLANPPLLCCC